jgi:hypothetical protein
MATNYHSILMAPIIGIDLISYTLIAIPSRNVSVADIPLTNTFQKVRS